MGKSPLEVNNHVADESISPLPAQYGQMVRPSLGQWMASWYGEGSGGLLLNRRYLM